VVIAGERGGYLLEGSDCGAPNCRPIDLPSIGIIVHLQHPSRHGVA
jgi:hypothetical protein